MDGQVAANVVGQPFDRLFCTEKSVGDGLTSAKESGPTFNRQQQHDNKKKDDPVASIIVGSLFECPSLQILGLFLSAKYYLPRLRGRLESDSCSEDCCGEVFRGETLCDLSDFPGFRGAACGPGFCGEACACGPGFRGAACGPGFCDEARVRGSCCARGSRGGIRNLSPKPIRSARPSRSRASLTSA